MVGVKNNLQIKLHTPVNYLFYTAHPFCVNFHCRLVYNMREPSYRYSDSIKSSIFDRRQHLFCRFWISPGGLPLVKISHTYVNPCTVGIVPLSTCTFEGITQIPPHFYLFYPRLGIFSHACCVRKSLRSLTRNGICHHHK